MSRSSEEKRGSKRTLYVRTLSYTAVGGRSGQGEIRDIGDGGVRIRTGLNSLEKGTVIMAYIPLSLPPISVPVLSQVRWVREHGPTICEIGLQYVL